MRKKRSLMLLVSVLLVLVFVMSFIAACAKPAPAPSPAPSPAPAPKPAPAPPAEEEKVIKWKVQTFGSPADTPSNIVFSRFLESIKRLTNGRLDPMPMLLPGTVCGTFEMFDAVSEGLLDWAFTTGAFHTGTIPVGYVESGLSFGFNDTWELNEVLYYRGLLDIYQREYAKHNIHLAAAGNGIPAILMTTKPVRKVEDLKGMKIRATGEQEYILSYLGAKPVKVAFGEMYTSLQTGVIDGVCTVSYALTVMNLNEVIKYVIMPGFRFDSTCHYINMDKWNELPDDIKKLLSDPAIWQLWSFMSYVANMNSFETRDLAQSEAKGVEIINLPEAEVAKLRTASREVGWKFVAEQDPTTAEAVGIIEKYLKEIGRID